MPAPKGNQLWKFREKHGRPKQYKTPADLEKGCLAYFKWVEDNPLKAAETVKFQGSGSIMMVPKMRAMTQAGLCLHLGISQQTWANYRDAGDDFLEVVTWAEAIIFEQKFSGAAADMLNPNIIARDLGLADKQDVTGQIAILGREDHDL